MVISTQCFLHISIFHLEPLPSLHTRWMAVDKIFIFPLPSNPLFSLALSVATKLISPPNIGKVEDIWAPDPYHLCIHLIEHMNVHFNIQLADTYIEIKVILSSPMIVMQHLLLIMEDALRFRYMLDHVKYGTWSLMLRQIVMLPYSSPITPMGL